MRRSKPRVLAIAERPFVRLKEMTMTQPISANTGDHTDAEHGLPWSSDHYALACRWLDEADQPGTPISDVHAFVVRAGGRLDAAQTAAMLWPTDLARLEAVAAAARTYLDSAREDDLHALLTVLAAYEVTR